MGKGDLVICVDDSGLGVGGYGDEIVPRRGVIYTIRDFHYSNYWEAYQIRLVEIINLPHLYFKDGIVETGFKPNRFRPIDPRRISVFREALVPGPRQRVRA